MKLPRPGDDTSRRFDRLAMTFKLGSGDLEKALTAKGVEPFEPMKGRAMTEWVLVPLEHSRSWSRLAEQAFAFLA